MFLKPIFMLKLLPLSVILVLIACNLSAQSTTDQIFLKSGDTIACKITYVNEANIFYTLKTKPLATQEYVALERVRSYNWTSKNLPTHPEISLNPYDSTRKLKIGLRFAQQLNYPILHTSAALSASSKGHSVYIGPAFTHLNGKSFSSVDTYKQTNWGLNFGYRYCFDSHWKNTHVLVQIDFSVYQVHYIEHSLGNPMGWENKKTIVENNLGIGLNHKLSEQLELFGGLGFGSTNGFFLMLDQFIAHSFLGIEYKLPKRPRIN
jgi:hypothetical protein